MFCMVSTLFHVLCFPNQGKIVTVNHLAFFSSNSSNGNVSYVGNINIPYESFAAGIFKESSLMGTFSLPPLNVASINMISTCHGPWVIPYLDQINSFGDFMLLSPIEKAYQAIISTSVVTTKIHDHFSLILDAYWQSPWLNSWDYPDPLNEAFSTNESIIEVMSL